MENTYYALQYKHKNAKHWKTLDTFNRKPAPRTFRRRLENAVVEAGGKGYAARLVKIVGVTPQYYETETIMSGPLQMY